MNQLLEPPVFCCLNCAYPQEHVLQDWPADQSTFPCPKCGAVLLERLAHEEEPRGRPDS